MSKAAILASVAEPNMKKDLPKIWPGDSVKVHVKVREGNKERSLSYELNIRLAHTFIIFTNFRVGESLFSTGKKVSLIKSGTSLLI